jgi:hypothetical protein
MLAVTSERFIFSTIIIGYRRILQERAELLINTNAVDNVFKIWLLSTVSVVFTLDNTFISSVLYIFTSLIINQFLVIIKANLIRELTFIIYGKAKTA